MMPLGLLSASFVRSNYLNGIALGGAWSGAAGDAAISALLALQISRAESMMGIHFRRWRVVTFPATGMVLGTDYDLAQPILPFFQPVPSQTHYVLTLHYHDVQAVTKLQLFQGYDIDNAPILIDVPLTTVTFSSYHEKLLVPVGLVVPPVLTLGWGVEYLIGLGAIPPEVLEWVSLGAAIEVLGSAGAGADLGGAVSAGTLRMDGIEERTDYGTGSRWQGGGLYAGQIGVLRGARDDIDLRHLRMRYQNTLGDCTTLPAGSVIPTPPYEQTVCVPRVYPMAMRT